MIDKKWLAIVFFLFSYCYFYSYFFYFTCC